VAAIHRTRADDVHVTSCEVRDADHYAGHQDHQDHRRGEDRHQGRLRQVHQHQDRQDVDRIQGERHLDHQDVDRLGRRGEDRLGHPYEGHQDRQGENHQDQDGCLDLDENLDLDGNQMGHSGAHREPCADQEVAEWVDRMETWDQVVAE
jgi:hypothetical protein